MMDPEMRVRGRPHPGRRADRVTTAPSVVRIGGRVALLLMLAIVIGGCATPGARMCRVAGNVGLPGTECNGYGQCIVPCVNIPGHCNAQPDSSECRYCNAHPNSPDCRYRF